MLVFKQSADLYSLTVVREGEANFQDYIVAYLQWHPGKIACITFVRAFHSFTLAEIKIMHDRLYEEVSKR